MSNIPNGEKAGGQANQEKGARGEDDRLAPRMPMMEIDETRPSVQLVLKKLITIK